MRFRLCLALLCLVALPLAADEPYFQTGLIFPLNAEHNHSSSIVELPGGDLLVCWYRGSGERQADDVQLLAARKNRDSGWSDPFPLADTPNFPDANPIFFTDSQARLHLMWPAIIANEWHTALLKYRNTLDYPLPGAEPRWDVSDSVLLIPRNFEERVAEWVKPLLKAETDPERKKYLEQLLEKAGSKYFRRMGWMPRTHPLELPGGRILFPLYSDGFDFSLVAFTDDYGKTWKASEPMLGLGAVQPSIVRKNDGTLVAYFRDNGPAPKRVLRSESRDDGISWTVAKDIDIPNPGSSVEVIRLASGEWLMLANDTERGRHSLVAILSDDEGATWRWKRRVEYDSRKDKPSTFHYPSVIQSRDGAIHVTYSYFVNHLKEGAPRKSIKHARFNTEWVKAGEKR